MVDTPNDGEGRAAASSIKVERFRDRNSNSGKVNKEPTHVGANHEIKHAPTVAVHTGELYGDFQPGESGLKRPEGPSQGGPVAGSRWSGGGCRRSHGAAKDINPRLLCRISRSGVRTVHAPAGPTEPSLERGDAAQQLLTGQLAPTSHPGPAPSWNHFLC